jgi:ribonuclease VapC
MAECVLDSSAVLAWLNLERGSQAVEPMLSVALVSAVNLAEIVTRLVDTGRTDEEAIDLILGADFQIADFDSRLALRAGALRRQTRHLGLSLGERACLALAERERLPVLTADRAWASLDIGVEIRLIR